MYDIIELNSKLVAELKEIAKELNVEKYEGLKKQDLIYKILDEQALADSPKKAKSKPDPKSEAKPEIWSNFSDFSGKAKELEKLALGLSTTIASADDLGPAMRDLGANCKACHGPYRE